MVFMILSLILFHCSCTHKQEQLACEAIEEAEVAEKEAEKLSRKHPMHGMSTHKDNFESETLKVKSV